MQSYKTIQNRPLHPTLLSVAGGIKGNFYKGHGQVLKWLVVYPAILAAAVWCLV